MLGNIIGYDLNEHYCQISFYDEQKQEPHTMETTLDNYQIPFVIGKTDEGFVIGNDAKRVDVLKNGYATNKLYQKVLEQEKVTLGEDTYEAVWLLAKFVELSLKSFSEIQKLVFTVPVLTEDFGRALKGAGQRVGVSRNDIYVQDYKESFCYYMLYQPKELWQYEAALFHCDRYEVKAFMLRKIQTGYGKGKDAFVTVDEVASAQMKELAAIYPVLNVDRAKDADVCFKQFIQGVFNKKLVSSVFLVGEGFENNWYPQSLKVLCNGRRAFLGNNLYSKGACYTAYTKQLAVQSGPIYLDETKLMDQICLKMRVNGRDEWYPIVPWGVRWYEADSRFEILLENTEDMEVHIESLAGNELSVEKISLEGLPNRKNYSLRLEVQTLFTSEKVCKLILRDLGFGEFFPATGFCVEKDIHIGGSNGQYHSLS